MAGVRRWVEQVEAHAAVKVGTTTTCRFALRDPGHVCTRRDGRPAFGFDECFYEQRAQVAEQGGVLRDAEGATMASDTPSGMGSHPLNIRGITGGRGA